MAAHRIASGYKPLFKPWNQKQPHADTRKQNVDSLLSVSFAKKNATPPGKNICGAAPDMAL